MAMKHSLYITVKKILRQLKGEKLIALVWNADDTKDNKCF